MAFHPSHANTGEGEVTETGFAAAVCNHSLGFTVQSNLSVGMFAPGPASPSDSSGSGSTWAVTCCVELLPGEGRRGNSITRGEHCIFWELGWGVFACVWVFSPETPQLILLVSLSLLSPLAKIDFVILCSFLLGLMFSHVKCWVWICT